METQTAKPVYASHKSNGNIVLTRNKANAEKDAVQVMEFADWKRHTTRLPMAFRRSDVSYSQIMRRFFEND